ncbi:MAG TPA: DsbA family oxidoreductase [Acidimicrobiales bacterium]|nr:DsbA family oxidoreductase [Acidimicrobiales bacterium]
MNVDIWSDVACPWCYIGKRRFEAALSRFAHRDEVDVRWRSFELDPEPAIREGTYVERLAAKYGVTEQDAEATIDTMIEAGAQHGVVLRFDKARPANTFDAHRLLHLAGARGAQHDLKERMLHATFTRGACIADHDVLAGLAADAGLEAAETAAVLSGDAYAADVRADERRAAELGITSVPYFVVAGSLGVSGAQPPDLLLQVLQEGWDAPAPRPAQSS